MCKKRVEYDKSLIDEGKVDESFFYDDSKKSIPVFYTESSINKKALNSKVNKIFKDDIEIKKLYDEILAKEFISGNDLKSLRKALGIKLEDVFEVARISISILGYIESDQVEKLLPLLSASSADIKILLGDLNEWFLWGRPLRRLHRIFGDTPAPTTFPARWPLFALDRLWVQPLSVMDSVQTHRSVTAKTASDHLPLLAQIHIP